MKIIYFADYLGTFTKTPEQEAEEIKLRFEKAFKNNNIIEPVEIFYTSNIQDFVDKKYDILLFDWGGVSSIGQSGFVNFNVRFFAKHIQNKTCKYHCLISSMLKNAFLDAKSELTDCDNVFFNLDDLIDTITNDLKTNFS